MWTRKRISSSSIAKRNRQVVALQETGPIAKALAEAEETERLATAALAESDVERAKSICNLAAVQAMAGDTPKALESFERAVVAMRVAVGERHALYGRTLSVMASFLAATGNGESAELLFVKAIMVLAPTSAENTSHLGQVIRELAGLHLAMSEREAAEAAGRTESEPSTGIGAAHFERSRTARSLRRELDDLPPELREFAEKNLDDARRHFGAGSTHARAEAIIDERSTRGEPFALFLRGFEGESYDYEVSAPRFVADDPQHTLIVGDFGRVSEVERDLSRSISGHLAALAVASPASLDPSQGAEGAILPRLILPDESWLDAVRTLINLAHLIVVDGLALNPGLRLELEAIAQGGKCDNTMIFLYRDRSKVDDLDGTSQLMADIVGGRLAATPQREWLTKDHPLLVPFKRIEYVEDLAPAGLASSASFVDSIASAPLIRSATRLGKKGTALVESGNLADGAIYLQAALVMARDIPGWSERTTTWFNLGVLTGAIEQWDKALEAHRQGLAAAKEMNDLSNQGRNLTMMGDVHFNTGRYADSVDLVGAALLPLEAADDTAYLTRSLRLLAQACQALGDGGRAEAADAELRRLERDGRWNRAGAGEQFRTLFPSPE